MKELIITSEQFVGEVRVLYGEQNELLKIDFTQGDLTPSQKHKLKTRVAPLFESIEKQVEYFDSKTVRIVLGDHQVDFERDFWQPYGKKINKARCLKDWDKLSKADKLAAVNGLKTYKNHLKLNTWKNQADPENYLKRQMWQNEWK
jgi:hypothetical protein